MHLTSSFTLLPRIAAEPSTTGTSGIQLTPDVTVVERKNVNHLDIDTRIRPFYDHLQKQGIPVDSVKLQKAAQIHQLTMDGILDSLQAKYGFRPNPNRPEDYAKIAQAAGHALPKSPTGKTKTDEWTIERAAKDVPDLKQLQKARSVRRNVSVLNSIGSSVKNGRVYPEYKMDPELGRTHAGGDVNPMNWSKDEQSAVSMPGHQILIADYERLEIKVLAAMSNDPTLKNDLAGDPYIELAKSIFKTNAPSKEQRAQAKIAMLATLYGQTDKGLAAQLGVPTYQAIKIQQAWHKRYPEASKFMLGLVANGRLNGHAQSHHGRIKKLDKPTPEANDRLAVNSPVQNTGGDLSRLGFHNVWSDHKLKELGVQPLTTVHDSIILAVPLGVDINQVKQLVEKAMTEIDHPEFGLTVSFKVGPSWQEAA